MVFSESTQRKYDIDWLRTIIVLSIIPFHALVIFNQDKSWVMFVKDKADVPAFDFIDQILGRFNMAALFLLAGMAILVIRLNTAPLIKLLLIIAVSYALCFAVYELLRRTKHIGILFGASYRPSIFRNQ